MLQDRPGAWVRVAAASLCLNCLLLIFLASRRNVTETIRSEPKVTLLLEELSSGNSGL